MVKRDAMTGRGRAAQAMEEQHGWGALRETFPPAPEIGAMLRMAAEEAPALERVRRWRLTLRFAAGLALALLLALCGWGYFSLRALRGEPAGAAWACSGGYVVRLSVFKDVGGQTSGDLTPPLVVARMEETALAWARDNGLDVFSQASYKVHGGIDPRSHRYLAYFPAGNIGFPPAPVLSYASFLLAGVTPEEAQALCAVLAPLPGVLAPQCLSYDVYRDVTVPEQVRLGRGVQINGMAYQYPQDFARAQAKIIEYYLNTIEFKRPRSPLYCAFRRIDRSRGAPLDPLELGDAYKVEQDADGRLVFTTLAARWDEGRRLRDANPDQERAERGVMLEIPPDCPEPGLDPLRALADRLCYEQVLIQQPEGYSDHFRTHVGAAFTLIPPAQLLAAGAPKPAPEDAARARMLADRMKDVLRAWRRDHPDCWDELRHDWFFHWRIDFAGKAPVLLDISYYEKSTAPARELLAQLAAIPGVPEPFVETHDYAAESGPASR
jgi:hypothetical protein